MFIDDFDTQIQCDEFIYEYEEWLDSLGAMWEEPTEEENEKWLDEPF
jgi:hypothetical protein